MTQVDFNGCTAGKLPPFPVRSVLLTRPFSEDGFSFPGTESEKCFERTADDCAAPDALRDRELGPASEWPFGPEVVGVDTGDELVFVPEGVVKRVWLWLEKYPGLPAIKTLSS